MRLRDQISTRDDPASRGFLASNINARWPGPRPIVRPTCVASWLLLLLGAAFTVEAAVVWTGLDQATVERAVRLYDCGDEMDAVA